MTDLAELLRVYRGAVIRDDRNPNNVDYKADVARTEAAIVAALTAPEPTPSSDDVAVLDELVSLVRLARLGLPDAVKRLPSARAAVLSRMGRVTDDEATVERVARAICDWVRDDAPTAIKMTLQPAHVDAMARAAIKAMQEGGK